MTLNQQAIKSSLVKDEMARYEVWYLHSAFVKAIIIAISTIVNVIFFTIIRPYARKNYATEEIHFYTSFSSWLCWLAHATALFL